MVKSDKDQLEAKLLEGLASGPPVEATDAYWKALEAKIRNKILNIAVRPAEPEDSADIRALHARAFGPGRFARTAYRLREGTAQFSPFCRVCRIDGQLAAAVRFTPILISGKGGALLLGPLAVDPAFANQGHGRGLVATALEVARSAGIALVVLVGDEPYYARLGFRPVPHGQIVLPGPVDPERLLAAELAPGVLPSYSGLVASDRAA
jgi:predicted N-acetyltransferase YhbS